MNYTKGRRSRKSARKFGRSNRSRGRVNSGRRAIAARRRREDRLKGEGKLLAPLVRDSWADHPEYLTLPIDAIVFDAELSPRTGINETVVDTLKEALRGGCRLPPCRRSRSTMS